ncbi:diploid state maintenance protein chpA [Trichodelitschia bisporula]|uniref:Diploid state maintenance protein chpA n=1 Tax=Trichodelitschia bisporula TaxID=703511 RepID=A0A6G1I068_9PEZI|nr:diploid state maintenance protein chpA [Trichodelitschia bisporula]
MAQKCIHKGCQKLFTDPAEECHYHPGPPEFHEGQKGWKCCKKRVLTFDEFLAIPPCTTGTHSTVDDTPAPAPKSVTDEPPPGISAPAVPRLPTAAPRVPPSPAPPEVSDDDEPGASVPKGAKCRRRGCSATYEGGSRDGEQCVHHPGAALFHEGSKGWTCCKRRVLEFDEFMRIEGCRTKERHLFNGSGKEEKKKREGQVEKLDNVRCDFYQTATQVIASVYLKKIDKAASSVEFVSDTGVDLDLRTTDGKEYMAKWTLYGPINPAASSFKIMGTKLELTLEKADGAGWSVLRADDRPTGEIIQAGRAGRLQ